MNSTGSAQMRLDWTFLDLSFFLGYKSSLSGTLKRVLSRAVESTVGGVGWGVKSPAGKTAGPLGLRSLVRAGDRRTGGGAVPKQLSARLPAVQ